MKKTLAILSLVVLLGASACGRRYTCPTYLKNADENQKIRVQADKSATESRN